jgi:hypothetical protein
MSITVARINAAIAKAGIPLEIVRCQGYQYFIYDTATDFETISIYVAHLNIYTVGEWVNEARYALDEIMQRLER